MSSAGPEHIHPSHFPLINLRSGHTEIIHLAHQRIIQHIPGPQGAINTVLEKVGSFTGQRFILKTANPERINPEEAPRRELKAVGFLLPNKDGFKRRSYEEQAKFALAASERGLNVMVPTHYGLKDLLIPYEEGSPFDDYLFMGGIQAAGAVLDDLTRAHASGFIYGDRWPKNVWLLPDQKHIKQLDFEIELSGTNAKEVEIAQFVYGLFSVSSNKQGVQDFLQSYFSTHQEIKNNYNFATIAGFLTGFTNYFAPIEVNSAEVHSAVNKFVEFLKPSRRLLFPLSIFSRRNR